MLFELVDVRGSPMPHNLSTIVHAFANVSISNKSKLAMNLMIGWQQMLAIPDRYQALAFTKVHYWSNTVRRTVWYPRRANDRRSNMHYWWHVIILAMHGCLRGNTFHLYGILSGQRICMWRYFLLCWWVIHFAQMQPVCLHYDREDEKHDFLLSFWQP